MDREPRTPGRCSPRGRSSPDERSRAVALYEALMWAKSRYDSGDRDAVAMEAGMTRHLEARGLQVQYAVAADSRTLQLWAALPESRIAGPCVLLIAAKLGGTRLIDNMLLA